MIEKFFIFTYPEAVIPFNFSCSVIWEHEEILVSASRRETVDLNEIFSYFYREISICNCVDFKSESDSSFFHCFLLSEV